MTDLRVAIDDLTWADLLRLALEDVPGASQGRWTLHGPVDPGVTLVELFAWQLEQRLFMAEQLPDDAVRASLVLLGVAEPAAPRAARTVLVFGDGPAERLVAGTAIGLHNDPTGRRFALESDGWVLPVHTVAVEGRLAHAGDVLELVPDGWGTVPATAELSLLVEVAAPPGVDPSWSVDAAKVHPPAELRWSAVGADGVARTVHPIDGTGGFRRSGVVRLAWPAAWDAPGIGRRTLRVEAVRGSYTEPVRVHAVHPNAVVALHRVESERSVELGHLLPLPDQRVRLPDTAGNLLDAWLSLTEIDGETYRWEQASSWVGVGPADRRFRLDRERGELIFGDGRSGRIPRPIAGSQARVVVGLGGGAAGNIGSSRDWATGRHIARNPVAADGGMDAETLAAVRMRAAATLARRDRTVTADDVRDLAVSTPGAGIARAHVAPGRHPDFPCADVDGAVLVTVVPHADRTDESAAWTAAPRPDDGALATVLERLLTARLIGQEMFVTVPVFHAVRVHVAVAGGALPPAARRAVQDVLTRHLDPLRGGTDGSGWPFGGPIRPAELVGVVQRVIGPELSVAELSVSLDDGPPADCGDTAVPDGHLVWLAELTVGTAANATSRGGLR